jgi:hypothetical protein
MVAPDVDSGTHLDELRQPLQTVLEDRFVHVRIAVGLGEQDARRRLEVRREAGVRTGFDVGGAIAAVAKALAVNRDPIRFALGVDAGSLEDLEEGDHVVARRPRERDPTAGDRTRDRERPGLDPVGDHVMLGAAETAFAVDLDRVRVGPLDLGAHLVEEQDQVIDLGFAGGGPDHGVTVGKGGGENRVLGAHDRDEREPDLGAAQPARRGREVVAVPVFDRRSKRAHRFDMEVDGSAADPIAAGVADDHPPEPRQKRAEEHERRAHLGGGLEWHEQPLDVARGDLVDVVRRMVHDDAEIAERLGHHPDVLDLGDVREPAALAGQGRGREHLQRGVLRAADRDLAAERHAALDLEELPGHRCWRVLPVEGSGVSHGGRPPIRRVGRPRRPRRRRRWSPRSGRKRSPD